MPERTGPCRVGRIFVLIVVLLICIPASEVRPDSSAAKYKEYEIKAAFIYNFLKFIDWPEEKMTSNGDQIIIGIIGNDPFGSTTDVFKGKSVEDRKLVVKKFDSRLQLQNSAEDNKEKLTKQTEELRKCHLLFICPSEKKIVPELVEALAGYSVLTIGDNAEFIKSGGVINFFLEEKKVRFDINLTAAENAGLKIRSQLLRLAKNVLKKDSQEDS